MPGVLQAPCRSRPGRPEQPQAVPGFRAGEFRIFETPDFQDTVSRDDTNRSAEGTCDRSLYRDIHCTGTADSCLLSVDPSMETAAVILLIILLPAALITWRVRVSGCGLQAWFLYQVARFYTSLMFRLRATGHGSLPEEGAALIISNHTSPVDPMLIWADMRRCWPGPRIRLPGFMMAREYYEIGGLPGWVFRVMQSIPVDRDGHDMGPARAALRRLKEGHLVSVFPEGRINDVTPDGRLLPGDTGAAWLALKARVPVIPVYIRHAPRGTTMLNSFLVRTHSFLIWGQPIDLSAWYDRRITHELLEEVTDLLMTRLAELGGVPTAERPASPPETSAESTRRADS